MIKRYKIIIKSTQDRRKIEKIMYAVGQTNSFVLERVDELEPTRDDEDG